MATRPLVIPASLTGTRFTTNMSGRQVDTLIAQGLDFVGNGQDPVSLEFGDRERVVAGPQKLVQRWMIVFLTKFGSIPSFPTFGTNFMTRLEQGSVVTDADVQSEFAEAEAMIEDTLGSLDIDKPDDERLDSAVLVDFALTHTDLNLTVNITSRAGAGTTVILPIPLETP